MPLTAEEALRQAEAEGLVLVRSDRNSSGFKCVSVPLARANVSKPYLARVRRDGHDFLVGSFATPEEAALAVARTPEGRAAAASSPQAKPEPAASTGVKPEPSPPALPPAQAAASGPPAAGLQEQLNAVVQRIRSSQLTGMAGVEAVLDCLSLGQYRDAFDDEGYDDPRYLADDMAEEEMQQMCENTKMKRGHAAKLCTSLARVPGRRCKLVDLLV